MKIDRSSLLMALKVFARSGNGLVVGGPGAGKTYLVGELSRSLEQEEVPNLQIAVDALGDGTDAEIREALDLDSDLLAKLRAEDVREAVLVFDGYDAARSEKTQRNIFELIRRAVQELPTWNVIVVVRTYDAQKSPELGDLFPSTSPMVGGDPSISCRHFVIPPLEEIEIQSLGGDSRHLLDAYTAALNDLRELLRVPFNLWLLERMLPEATLGEFTEVSSQVQLLGLFWHRRVRAGPRGLNREHVLTKIAEKMISQRSLSVLRVQVFEPANSQDWSDLFSQEVLVERGFGNRIRFGHNILFDYAVSVLMLEEDPSILLRFLKEDASRQLFLRPSFVFYFARLWHDNSDHFWHNYRFLLSEGGIESRLLGRLVPPSVLVQECDSRAALAPLLEMQDTHPFVGPRAALYALRSLRAWKPRSAEIWVEFLESLASKPSPELEWEIGLLIESFLNELTHPPISMLGRAARKLMDWIWTQRSLRRETANTLLGRFGVPLVAKTFWTDPTASRALLKPVLALVQEQGFPIQPLYQLAANVSRIASIDSDLVGDVYRTIFSAQELSESKTQMWASTVLVMTSTRKQDFGMCHYLLLEYFPTFIQVGFHAAVSSGIAGANAHVIRRHAHEPAGREQFAFRGSSSTYIADGSVFWDSHFDPYEPLLVLEQICSRLDEILKQSGRTPEVEEALDLFRDNAQVAFCWKRLLRLVAKHPGPLGEAGVELCVAPVILSGRDTLYEVGAALSALASVIAPKQMESIEKVILDLKSEAIRRRLLSQIPLDVLVTTEARQLRNELTQKNQTVANDPLVQFRTSSFKYTKEDWLKDKGVDLERPANKQLRALSTAVSNAIDSTKNPISADDLQAAYNSAHSLWSELQEIIDADDDVRESAWAALGQYARFVITNVKNPNEAISLHALSVLLACGVHPSPEPQADEDATFKSATWSSSPRTEAAQLLPVWFARTGDSATLKFFLKLLEDPVPAVRFLSAHELWRLVERAPVEFWSAIRERIIKEVNDVVLQGLLDSLGRVIPRHERQGVEVLSLVRDRARSNHAPRELADLYSDVVMWLVIVRENSDATRFLQEILDHPVQYSRAVRRAAFDAGVRIVGDKEEPAQARVYGQNAAKWSVRIIDAAQSGIQELMGTEPDQGEDAPLTDLYRSIDAIVTRLWVARNGLESSEVGEFYILAKTVLSRVTEFAMTPDLGVLAPSTAHHAMEFLNDFVRIDPSGVLKMAWQITSRSPGYNLDSLAIDQVVKLVEVILADHRDQMRQPESLQHLLDLLEIFSETGWSQALRLVWRLDEVFR